MPEVATVTPKLLLHEGTPAQIRDALIPEEVERFDDAYAEALRVAGETYSLTKLDACLEGWRRIAAMTAAQGHERHREMLALAAYITEHGHVPPGTKTTPGEEHKAQIRARLAAAQS